MEEAERLIVASLSQLQVFKAAPSQTLQDLQPVCHLLRPPLSLHIQLRRPEKQVRETNHRILILPSIL